MRALLIGLLAFTAVSCDKDAPSSEQTGEQPSSEQAVVEVAAPCEFVNASRSLVTTNIETANGDCSIGLPSEVTVGEFSIAISVAGRDDLASVQITAGEGAYYYANVGTVTIEEVGNGRIRGRFSATDDNPPETGGPFTGEFDVAY